MKNALKLLGIIALIVVIGFSMVSCIGDGSGGKSINSVDELKEYLNKQPANSPDNPIKVNMSVNDQMIKDIAEVIRDKGKYVSLTLSGTALTTIPDNTFYECETLTSIIIPKSVTSIEGFAFCFCSNLTSVTFQGKIDPDNIGVLSFGLVGAFDGNLDEKYGAGGPGTYTRAQGGEMWTKVGGSSDAKTQNEGESDYSLAVDATSYDLNWSMLYACSPHNLKTFKARYYEIKNNGTFDRSYSALYIVSSHDLKTFKDRLNEIKNDGTVQSYYWKLYAVSSQNLEMFKDKLNEIEKDSTVDEDYFVAYAGSPHNLKTFKARLNEIENDDIFQGSEEKIFYLMSKHNLKTYKERLKELRVTLTKQSGSTENELQQQSERGLPTIGVAIHKLDDTFMSYIRDAIEQNGQSKAIITIVDSQNAQLIQNEQVDQFVAKKMKVIAISLVDRSAAGAIVEKARSGNVPVVFFTHEPFPEDMNKWDKVYYVGAKVEDYVKMQAEVTLSEQILDDAKNQGSATFDVAYALAIGAIPSTRVGKMDGKYVWVP